MPMHAGSCALRTPRSGRTAIVTGMGQAGRSIFAMLGGLATVLAIDGLCYFVSMHGFGISFDHPTNSFLIFSLLYSYVSRTLGGAVAAAMARRRPLLHGIVLAALLLLVGFYNLSKGFGVFGRATAYVVLLNVAGPLFSLLGAYLWSRTRSGMRVAE